MWGPEIQMAQIESNVLRQLLKVIFKKNKICYLTGTPPRDYMTAETCQGKIVLLT